MKIVTKTLPVLLCATMLSFAQGTGEQTATTSKATPKDTPTSTSTSTSPTIDKVQDLEMRLLIQKITTKELQLQQLSQSLNTDRQTLNSMVTAACKSKGIEMVNCTVKMESDKDGGEYLTFSKTAVEEKTANMKQAAQAQSKGDK